METVMESTFYLKDDIDNLLDDIIKKGSWGQAEAAKSIKERLKSQQVFYMALQRSK